MYRTQWRHHRRRCASGHQEVIDLDEARPPAGLRVPDHVGEHILLHLRAAAPAEGVGLVAIAPLGEDGFAEATCFYPGTNLDASPSRYTMDPAEVLAAFQDMEARGWRLGAIAHSHPVTPAIPSATDLREAHYRDALMVIVSLAGAVPESRAWQVVQAEPASLAVIEVPLLGMSAPFQGAVDRLPNSRGLQRGPGRRGLITRGNR